MSQINSNIKERRGYREDEGGRGEVGCMYGEELGLQMVEGGGGCCRVKKW